MLNTNIRVKTDKFDGPLNLLLHLIQKEDMNINDLNLNVITKQYLNYLNQMRDLNFDVAGDYLFLAATLILLKSRACLTEEDVKNLKEQAGDLAITSQSELIKRLEELQRFKKVSENLWSIPKLGHEVFTKPKVNKKTIINSILTPIDLGKLTASMIELIQKNKRSVAIVRRDRISIKDKLSFLKEKLKEGETVSFSDVLNMDAASDDHITDLIITFISILELA